MNFGLGNIAGSSSGANALIVKYGVNLTGPIWNRISTNAFITEFNAVALDSTGNVYAGGSITGTALGNFNGTTAQATSGFGGGKNAFIVKYDSTGFGLLSRVVKTAPLASEFFGVGVTYLNAIVGVGIQANNGSYTYEQNLTHAGPFGAGTNLIAVQFTQ